MRWPGQDELVRGPEQHRRRPCRKNRLDKDIVYEQGTIIDEPLKKFGFCFSDQKFGVKQVHDRN